MFNRQGLCSGRAWLILVAMFLAHALSAAPARADDLAIVRQRLLTALTGGAEYSATNPSLGKRLNTMTRLVVSNGTGRDPVGSGYWDTLKVRPQRTNVLWKDTGRPEAQVSNVKFAMERLAAMARAYAMPASPLYHNAELARDIIDSVEFLLEKNYNASTPHNKFENWFDLELGIPMHLLPVALMLGDALPAANLDRWVQAAGRFNPDPTKVGGHLVEATGANRMWKTRVAIMLAVLRRDEAGMKACQTAIKGLMETVDSGDGFYDDGTFIQHRVFVYNGGYGMALYSEYGLLLRLIQGTRWDADPQDKANYFARLQEGLIPIVFRGAMFDMMRGRDVARFNQTTRSVGAGAARCLLRAAYAASPELAAHYRSLAKAWIGPYFESSSDAAAMPLDDVDVVRVLEDISIEPAPPTAMHHTFHVGAKVVHLQPTWGAGLSMHSRRTVSFEAINGENVRGWNTAYGVLSLVTGDNSVFDDGYWPTVDAHRLPGTTVLQGAEPPGHPAKSSFIDGVGAPDGRVGVAAMERLPSDAGVAAKKSWFFFHDQIVCLGAGISSTETAPVETIIENRRLSGDAADFRINGKAPADLNWSPAPAPGRQFDAVRTVWIGGRGEGDGTGVYFPNARSLYALREIRSDSWKSINRTSLLKVPSTLIANRFTTLWIDHGVSPVDGQYEYVLLPTFTAEQTAAYAGKPTANVVANTAKLQAVTVGHDSAAVFYEPGEVTLGHASVATSMGCLVSLSRENDLLEMQFAFPLAKVGDPVQIDLGLAGRVIEADQGIKVINASPLRLTIAASAGKTFTLKLRTTE